MAGGINTYIYVNGNPLWAVDPFGLDGVSPGLNEKSGLKPGSILKKLICGNADGLKDKLDELDPREIEFYKKQDELIKQNYQSDIDMCMLKSADDRMGDTGTQCVTKPSSFQECLQRANTQRDLAEKINESRHDDWLNRRRSALEKGIVFTSNVCEFIP